MGFSTFGFIKEEEITKGYILYENVRESSANNGGITLSEKEAYDLSSLISNKITSIWYLHALNFLFSSFVFVIICWVLYRDRKNT